MQSHVSFVVQNLASFQDILIYCFETVHSILVDSLDCRQRCTKFDFYFLKNVYNVTVKSFITSLLRKDLFVFHLN